MKTPQELVDDLYETTHYYDGSWAGIDRIPDQDDGRPGWDTPASIVDAEEEAETFAEEPQEPHNDSALAEYYAPIFNLFVQAKKPVPPEVLADYPDLQAKPAAAKPEGGKTSHHATVAAAVDKLKGKDNYIGMDELLKHSGLPKADFHKAMMDLYRAGAISMSNLEGRHGADPALVDAAIHQDVGESTPHVLAHVTIRDEGKLKKYLGK